MAWFRRSRDEASQGDDALGSAASPEPQPEQAPQQTPQQAPDPAGLDGSDPVTPPAWAIAAPMPSAVPTIQRVLDRVDARGSTTMGRPAPLSLAPLGHAVTSDAPAGVVQATAVAPDPPGPAPPAGEQPPLEYVQRAPERSKPARPAPPAQLVVPAYQPGGLPSLPVAAADVQRAPTPPSLTTAPPPPQPPLVLPVGEVLAAPAPAPSPPEPPEQPEQPDAPLLADPAPGEPVSGPAAELPPVPATDLPLAPVQRHADHPGHVDGDEAPPPPRGAPRAAADVAAPATPPVGDAPLTSAASLAAPAGPPAGAAAPEAPPGDVQRAPDVPLPLAPVQRHADHPGHADGDDEPAPAVTEVQRAAADAPLTSAASLAPPPTLGDAALQASTASDLQRAPDVELPLAPVQRHADGDDEPAPAVTEVQRAAADAPLTSAASLAHPPTLGDAAVQAAIASDLQRAPDVELPLAPVQRHADGDDEPAPAVTEVQRAAADAPAAPLVGGAAPLVAPPTPPAEVTSAPPPAPGLPLPEPPVQRTAHGRRGGLGRPLPSVPQTSVDPGSVQRAPSGPEGAAPTTPFVGSTARPAPQPLAAVPPAASEDDADDAGPAGAAEGTPALDLVQRAAVDAVAPLVGAAPLGTASSEEGSAGPGEAPAPSLPDLALAQRAPLAGARPGSSASASTATPARSSPPFPPLVVAPLLGGRPFSTGVQRSAAGAASAPAGPVERMGPEALSPEPGLSYQPLAGIGVWSGAPPPELPGPPVEAPPGHVAAAVQRATGADVSSVRIRRDTGPVAQRLAARAFTHDGEVHIPAAVGSLSTGEGASLVAHELVHAGQQSVLGASRPHEHTPQGQALEAQARSAEHASLAGLELPSLPLAPPAAPVVQRAPAETASPSPFSPLQLSRLLDLADNPSAGGAAVQRYALPPPEPPPVPPVEASAAPPAAAPPAPKAQTPQELEELAGQLFPALRNLFRTELLGFRRRSGTSSDRPLS